MDRVAIVVVHGIADQKPGQTVREVARLLCVEEHGTAPYEQGEIQGVLVPVEKLEPAGGPLAETAAPAPMVQEARKQDRARRAPGTPSGLHQAHRPPLAETAAPPGGSAGVKDEVSGAEPKDLGMALNDYLLGRPVLPEDEALYESTRVSLRRRKDQRAVDVYEMYWADLSRLGKGGLTRCRRSTSSSFTSARSRPMWSTRSRSRGTAERGGASCSGSTPGRRG